MDAIGKPPSQARVLRRSNTQASQWANLRQDVVSNVENGDELAARSSGTLALTAASSRHCRPKRLVQAPCPRPTGCCVSTCNVAATPAVQTTDCNYLFAPEDPREAEGSTTPVYHSQIRFEPHKPSRPAPVRTTRTAFTMGSYLSIVNNTEDEWRCNISTDMRSLKIAGIIIASIGIVAASVTLTALSGPLIATMVAPNVLAVLGTSSAAIVAASATAADAAKFAATITSISSFSAAIATGVDAVIGGHGYKVIAPGETHRWGKMSLSLWQQGTCVRSYAVNDYLVRTETLSMRPIFSGSTAGSERKHDIKYWLEKNGVETTDVIVGRGSADAAPTKQAAPRTRKSAIAPKMRSLENVPNGRERASGHVVEFYTGSTDDQRLDVDVGDVVIIYDHKQNQGQESN